MSYHTPTITPKSNYTKRAAKEKAKEIQKRHVIDSHGRLYYFIKGTVMSFLISSKVNPKATFEDILAIG